MSMLGKMFGNPHFKEYDYEIWKSIIDIGIWL